MSNLFYLPRVTYSAGSKLYFYQTGTSTPQNSYTNIGLTVASSNPVVADSNGNFAQIYLDPSLPNYRVVLKTSADVTVATWDEVPAAGSTGKTLRLTDTAPSVILENTAATSEEGKWKIRAAPDTLYIEMLSDDELDSTPVISIQRTSYLLVDSIAIALGAMENLLVNGVQAVPSSAFKSSNTARSSTTSLANDPDLILIFPAGGKYEIEAYLRVVGNGSSGAGGFQCRFNYSGTVGSIGCGVSATRYINGSGAVLDGIDGTTGNSFATVASSGVSDYIFYKGMIHVANGGNLRIQWAQNSSNAAATNLMAGSYMTARRLTSATT